MHKKNLNPTSNHSFWTPDYQDLRIFSLNILFVLLNSIIMPLRKMIPSVNFNKYGGYIGKTLIR